MEDYDDVTTGPEENGALNLSFNSWPKVPCEVFTFSKQLVKLNLSNNKLDILSSDFGSLFLLQELDVSYNRIQSIEQAISQCVRLRHLNISSNELSYIPDSLYNCVMLQCLLCQNNKLTSISNKIGDLPMLFHVDISNNNLKCLPTALSSMAMLKILKFHGNKELSTSVPSYLLHDDNNNSKNKTEKTTNMSTITWLLKLQKEYYDDIESKTKIYQELEKSAINTEEMILREQEYLNELNKKVEVVNLSHPKGYIKRKKVIIESLCRWYQRWERIKNRNKSSK